MSSDFVIGVLATLTGTLILKLASKYAKSMAARKVVDLITEKETLTRLNDSLESTMKNAFLLVFATLIAFGAVAVSQLISDSVQMPWLVYLMNFISLCCSLMGLGFSYIGFKRMLDLRDYDRAINKLDQQIDKLS